MSVYVIQQNDYPVGVTTGSDTAKLRKAKDLIRLQINKYARENTGRCVYFKIIQFPNDSIELDFGTVVLSITYDPSKGVEVGYNV